MLIEFVKKLGPRVCGSSTISIRVALDQNSALIIYQKMSSSDDNENSAVSVICIVRLKSGSYKPTQMFVF